MKSEKKKAIRRGMKNNRSAAAPGANQPGVRIILRTIIPGKPEHQELYRSLSPTYTLQHVEEEMSTEAFQAFREEYIDPAAKFEAMIKYMGQAGLPIQVGNVIKVQDLEYQIARISYEYLDTPAVRWAVDFVGI